MNLWYKQNINNTNNNNRQIPPIVKSMSTLKSEILQLFEIFASKSLKRDHEQIIKQFIPQFLDSILTDYTNCCNIYRKYSCINVCSALIKNLGYDGKMNEFIPKIFGTLFQISRS